MRCWYLDKPEEQASVAILGELGIKAAPWLHYIEQDIDAWLQSLAAGTSLDVQEPVQLDFMTSQDTEQQALREELMMEGALTAEEGYCVVDGELLLDVRDSGDAWVRLALTPHDALVLPPKLQHRMSWQDGGLRFCKMLAKGSPAQKIPRAASTMQGVNVPDMRELVVELCRQFYQLGWVTGTGGSISIRRGNRIYMTPSGVQKERLEPEDLYVLDMEGDLLAQPQMVAGKRPKLSACAPLFQHAYRLRGAGAVIHSHGLYCVLATLICERQGVSEFRVTHQEMIKGLQGYGYHDELVIPIIPNTAKEEDLADSLKDAIERYPASNAVLVARHGIYVWGRSWEHAKTQAECLHYLFELAVRMDQMGMDPCAKPAHVAGLVTDADSPPVANGTAANGHMEASPPASRKRPREEDHAPSVVLLDIEGTTTLISFVKDKLFPYSIEHCEAYLAAHWDDPELQAVVQQIREKAVLDIKSGMQVPPIPPTGQAPPQAVQRNVASNLKFHVEADRKIGPIKLLQGMIWRDGYISGELMGHVFEDVPRAMRRWTRQGRRVAIFSSGSREAQLLLFQHSTAGDLRPCISAYFDTSSGPKTKSKAYKEIALHLGVEPEKMLFLTDLTTEASAASEAGCQVLVSARPGNQGLPKNQPHTVVHDFNSVLP